MLARPFVGLVAFNSWSEAGFWAPQASNGRSSSYGPRSILGQVPEAGAYIVLVHFAGGPIHAPENYGPEYQAEDLGSLWKEQDCREGAHDPDATWIDFFKWGRRLRLEVYCSPVASDETVAAVNALLASWRFDRVPAGDVGWATVQARQLLPDSVQPARFPIEAHPSLLQEGRLVWITEARIQAETVVVTFTYHWGQTLPAPDPYKCFADRCYWWRVEARTDVEVVLLRRAALRSLEENDEKPVIWEKTDFSDLPVGIVPRFARIARTLCLI